MNENTKTVLIAVAIIVIPCSALIGGFYIYKRVKQKREKDGNTPTNSTSQVGTRGNTGSPASAQHDNLSFPLRYAPSRKSDLVKKLQRALNWSIDQNEWNVDKLKVDGYFGTRTLTLVRKQWNKDTVDEDEYNAITYLSEL